MRPHAALLSSQAMAEAKAETEEEKGPMGLPKFESDSSVGRVLASVVKDRADLGFTKTNAGQIEEMMKKHNIRTLDEVEAMSQRKWEELDEAGLVAGTETLFKNILYGGFFPEYATEIASRGRALDFDSRLERNLITDPFYTPDALGEPLPSSPHACSVSMPEWKHIVGYEEGDTNVWDALALGYPRFVVHPYIAKLFRACEREFAKFGESCFAFPSKKIASRACDYIKHKNGPSTPLRIEQYRNTGIYAVVFPSGARHAVLKFWQHFGFVVSSRWAEAVLREHCSDDPDAEFPQVNTCDVRNHTLPPAFLETIERSEVLNSSSSIASKKLSCHNEAKHIIKHRLADASGGAPHAHAEDVYLYPSGMAAISSGYLAAQSVFPGCKSVQLGFPYLDVYKIQTVWGPGAHFISDLDPDWLKQIQQLASEDQLSSVVMEYPGNPLLQVPDLKALSSLLREKGVPLIIDDTIGSSVNFNLLEHCDVVVTSLTKWFNGTGDVMAGSMTLNRDSAFYDRFKKFTESEYECMMYAEDAIALEMNSRTYVERMAKVNTTTKPLVEYLRQSPHVGQVWYPDSVTDPQIVRKGHSGLFSFVLKDTEKSAEFYKNLKICKGPSLGTNFTLACPYTLLAHYDELDWAEGLGISRHLIRVSVGQEEPEDLIERFDNAFKSIHT